MQTRASDVEMKLTELHKTTQFYLNELKEAVSRQISHHECISYFTYALHLSHEQTEESFCLGSFHMLNLGNQPITNPFIDITISEEALFSFHGKFTNNRNTLSPSLTNGWERVNDRSNRHKFRLKPIGITNIPPGETISFSNFQLSWHPQISYSGSMTGTFFSDQHPKGKAALNSININGTSGSREEE